MKIWFFLLFAAGVMHSQYLPRTVLFLSKGNVSMMEEKATVYSGSKPVFRWKVYQKDTCLFFSISPKFRLRKVWETHFIVMDSTLRPDKLNSHFIYVTKTTPQNFLLIGLGGEKIGRYYDVQENGPFLNFTVIWKRETSGFSFQKLSDSLFLRIRFRDGRLDSSLYYQKDRNTFLVKNLGYWNKNELGPEFQGKEEVILKYVYDAHGNWIEEKTLSTDNRLLVRIKRRYRYKELRG